MNKPINQKPYYFKKLCHEGHGFGASFNILLSALHFYELGIFSGVEANYKKTGNYYDPKYGDNWWEYYFEPLRVGTSEGAQILEHSWFPGFGIAQFRWESKEENHRIFKKYIKIKSHILDKVNSYVDKNFNNEYTVGAFYRGTTARTGAEASLISYDEFSSKLSAILKHKGIAVEKCKIFIESDEEGFIDHMQSRFPKILYRTDQVRSKDGSPIHINPSAPYKLGEDTLINCLLFSKTNLIIKTQSNMIELASHFNPTIPDIALNTMNTIRLCSNEDPCDLYNDLKKQIQQGFCPYETYINLFSPSHTAFFC